MYKTIVFDLDGTLLDTLDDLTDAVNVALRAFSLPSRTKEEVRGFIGDGIAKLVRRAVGEEVECDFQAVLQTFTQYYARHCADKTKPYDGIFPLLKGLKAHGVKLAVLSNKADFAVKTLAERYFPQLFLEAVGENEAAGICKKPAPDALLLIMERLGASAEQTLYVGDSEVDLQTAKNAGVACACVTWGFRDGEFLKRHGATQLLDSPSKLLPLCGVHT